MKEKEENWTKRRNESEMKGEMKRKIWIEKIK